MANIDMTFNALSIEEEEDVPFMLPDLPQFSSSERNKMSIMGRTLNPECQNMTDLILDMLRKWQVYDRVRGVALSKERFQFIFKYEHDLEEIRNIPVNYYYYTEASIFALGDIIGKVVEIAFDLDKPQSKEYVRVKVNFDVSQPVRRSKVVNLPKGGSTTVWYDFERIQKQCYLCQRLTHEKDKCLLVIKMRKDKATARRQNILNAKRNLEPVLKESDPLFDELTEDQVGPDPHTGRLRIAPEVMQEIRLYLVAAEGPERRLKDERVKKSILDLKDDWKGQHSMLCLEAPHVLTKELDKGKGPTYEMGGEEGTQIAKDTENGGEKLMLAVIQAAKPVRYEMSPVIHSSERDAANFTSENSGYRSVSNGFSVGSSEASSSGTSAKKRVVRKRASTSRKKKDTEVKGNTERVEGVGKTVGVSPKRKADGGEREEWLGYGKVYTVEPIGWSGGLEVFSKNNVAVEVKSADRNLIDCFLRFGAFEFFVCCIMGRNWVDLSEVRASYKHLQRCYTPVRWMSSLARVMGLPGRE
ncbi:uncharacterized protein LOC112087477 [Eutrema salsugineum]|uniref:uncharacterized protein LOC112087477 n=1 Tax=Eutrema salsugineum TaxID=72664 RepID=UPI000CECF1E0|nr:uncharacterized protein LOC112087477 [Eutrema salsugineum]